MGCEITFALGMAFAVLIGTFLFIMFEMDRAKAKKREANMVRRVAEMLSSGEIKDERTKKKSL